MENWGLVSVFIVLILCAYYTGIKKGMYAPFSFKVIKSDVVVMFENVSTRDETISIIMREYVEKQRLKKKVG